MKYYEKAQKALNKNQYNLSLYYNNFNDIKKQSNIYKIKEECKKINPNIDYSSSNWKDEFIDNTNWNEIVMYKDLSESFIEYFKNYVIWDDISEYINLSEEFIEKYKDKVNWDLVSVCQDLSKSFVEKHEDKINFVYLFDNENISNEFIFDNINWFINIIESSWKFNDKKFKDKFYEYKKLFGNY